MRFTLLLICIKFSLCEDLDDYVRYFTCYFNKYNNILNSTLENEERDVFVEYAVNQSVEARYDQSMKCFLKYLNIKIKLISLMNLQYPVPLIA